MRKYIAVLREAGLYMYAVIYAIMPSRCIFIMLRALLWALYDALRGANIQKRVKNKTECRPRVTCQEKTSHRTIVLSKLAELMYQLASRKALVWVFDLEKQHLT